jgi:DNA-binding transcriptional LysR family regulator
MKITFKQVNLFVAVAERENLTKGAQAIFLSQPAASVTLQEFEMQLGEPLFDRVGKKLILNKNGTKLYPKAVELLERVQQMEHLFSNSGDLKGVLKVGASSTIGNYLMPELIVQFTRQFPHVKIVQTIGNTEEIIEQLEKFKLDIGFVEGNCYEESLEITPWREDELIIFSSPDHLLAKKSEITIQDLKEASWILREKGSGTREILEKYYRPEKVTLEIGSTQAIKKLVSKNMGISCASRHALLQELNNKELAELPVKNLKMRRDFLLLIHKEKYRTELIQSFLKKIN